MEISVGAITTVGERASDAVVTSGVGSHRNASLTFEVANGTLGADLGLDLQAGEVAKMRKAVATCVSAMALVSFGGTTGATTTPFVTGGGTGTIPFGPFAGDRLHISVTARQLPDGSVQGEFEAVQHTVGGLFEFLHGTVTCMTVIGNVAVTTGVITQSRIVVAPGEDVAGETMAITITDNGPGDDVIGLLVSFFPRQVITPCQPAPPFFPITEGNFTVNA